MQAIQPTCPKTIVGVGALSCAIRRQSPEGRTARKTRAFVPKHGNFEGISIKRSLSGVRSRQGPIKRLPPLLRKAVPVEATVGVDADQGEEPLEFFAGLVGRDLVAD
jgi:hypothetical protein